MSEVQNIEDCNDREEVEHWTAFPVSERLEDGWIIQEVIRDVEPKYLVVMNTFNGSVVWLFKGLVY